MPAQKVKGFSQSTLLYLRFNPRTQPPITDNHPVDIIIFLKLFSSRENCFKILGGADIPGKHHAEALRNVFTLGSIRLHRDGTVQFLSAVGEIGDALCIASPLLDDRNKGADCTRMRSHLI